MPTKKITPVSIGIFWNPSDREGISLWMQMRDDPEESRFNGLWEFPGGKIEEGESPSQAVVREIVEEVGVNISDEKRIKFFGHYKIEREDSDILLHVFLIYGDQKLLSRGRWIQFQEGEGAAKIKRETLPPNEQIIDDILSWIRRARSVEDGESMVWN